MSRPPRQPTRRQQAKNLLFPLAPPTRRHKFLLGVTIVLLVVWTMFLAVMAVMF